MFKNEPTEKDKERFWKYVEKGGSCWNWTGTKDVNGYGVYSIKHVLYRAHRASYFFKHGSIEWDKMCCHSCDNPSCVNPDHLFLGSPKDNTQDMMRKGRWSIKSRASKDRHGMAKLSYSDVAAMSEARKNGSLVKDLAFKFGIHPTTASNILNGRHWATKPL
jgi:hypothetical protein